MSENSYELCYGIVPWLFIDQQWHVLLRVRFSPTSKHYAVDTFHMKKKHAQSEDPHGIAAEALYEQSMRFMKFDKNSVDSVALNAGNMHIRLVFSGGTGFLSNMDCSYNENAAVLGRKGDGIVLVSAQEIARVFNRCGTSGVLESCPYRIEKRVGTMISKCVKNKGKLFKMPLFMIFNTMHTFYVNEKSGFSHVLNCLGGQGEAAKNCLGDEYKCIGAFHDMFEKDSETLLRERRIEDAELYPGDYTGEVDVNGMPLTENDGFQNVGRSSARKEKKVSDCSESESVGECAPTSGSANPFDLLASQE